MNQKEKSPEDIRARFEKMAENMPCMQECLAESIRSQIEKDFREKCPCPGCKFRRVVARLGKPHTKQDGVEVYPTTRQIEDAFSQLLALIERVRKYERLGDSALLMLEQELLASLYELKTQADHIENSYQSMNTNRNWVASSSGPPWPDSEITVGARLGIWNMIGVIESLDGESALIRFDWAVSRAPRRTL
jgi:hypothetical protein